MRRDEAYVLDILIAARKARGFTAHTSAVEFENNELLHNATVRMLEVIGEAAGKISDELKTAHPEIPWNEMVGMRNRLIHEYFRISLQTVWDTVQKDLPELIDRLEALLPGES